MSILTLRTYKDFKNITTDKRDTEMRKIISAVNSFITSYCGRTFTNYYSTSKTEYFDATEAEVYPSEYPLINVVSVKTSVDGGETYPTTLAPFTDYAIDTKNSRIVSNFDEFVITQYPINALEVIYTGGYDEVPQDIVLAAVNLTEYFLDEQYTPSKSLSGASTDNIIVQDLTARLPAHIRRVLEHYRSVNI